MKLNTSVPANIAILALDADNEVHVKEPCETTKSTAPPTGSEASTYRKQRRWEGAEKLELHVMEARKSKLGPDHPDTLTSMDVSTLESPESSTCRCEDPVLTRRILAARNPTLEVAEVCQRRDGGKDTETLKRSVRPLDTTTKPKVLGGSSAFKRAKGNYGTAITYGFGTTMASRSRKMLSRKRNLKFECNSCFDSFSKGKCITAPCSHIYCRGCIISLVKATIRDESLHPIKCCKQPLSRSQLSKALNAKLRTAFDLKSREFNTLSAMRIYCCNPKCSIFLGSSTNRAHNVVCSACRTSTCTKCKQRSHPGDTCQAHADTLKVRELAKREKWQTCPGCKAIVQLDEGCYHMTCRCRTEFCYLCGGKWKKCTCVQWHEDQGMLEALPRAAVNEVDPEPPRRAEPRSLRGIFVGLIRYLRG